MRFFSSLLGGYPGTDLVLQSVKNPDAKQRCSKHVSYGGIVWMKFVKRMWLLLWFILVFDSTGRGSALYCKEIRHIVGEKMFFCGRNCLFPEARCAKESSNVPISLRVACCSLQVSLRYSMLPIPSVVRLLSVKPISAGWREPVGIVRI